MRVRIISMILYAAISTSGCATIMSGNQQDVHVTSSPPGARVTAGSGATITTPGTVTLSTKRVHTLVAEYPGGEPQQRRLVKKLNNWVFCDILWDFGIITIPIDLISGSANELKPKTVHFSFPRAYRTGYSSGVSLRQPRPKRPKKYIKEKLKTDAAGKPVKDKDGNFIFVPVEENAQNQ